MKKLTLSITTLLLLASCSDKLYTTQELIDDEKLLLEVRAFCKENPSLAMTHHNCLIHDQALTRIWHCKEFKKTPCLAE